MLCGQVKSRQYKEDSPEAAAAPAKRARLPSRSTSAAPSISDDSMSDDEEDEEDDEQEELAPAAPRAR